MAVHPSWVQFDVHTGDEPQDPVLRDVVRPLLAGPAAADISRWLFLREADRLVVQAETSREGLTLDRGGAPISAAAATAVPLSGGAFAGPALGPLTRAVLAAIAPAVLGAIGRPDRLAPAAELMIGHVAAIGSGSLPGAAAASAARGGAPLSFLSFRSHADGFFLMSKSPDLARERMDRAAAPILPALESRVRELVQRSATGSALCQAWHAAVATNRPAVVEAFRSGLLTAPTGDDTGYLGAENDLSTSAFHRTVQDAPDFQHTLRTAPEFLAVRLLTSLLYLSLHQLGLPLVQRYLLCHAVSRACETVFAVNAVDVLAELTRGGPPAAAPSRAG